MEDLETMLTCKSLVRVEYSGERPIEQPSSWLLLKFPPGKQILILHVVLFGKANDYGALEIFIIFTLLSNFKCANYLYLLTLI
jgi:hypothetical protein